MSSGRAYQINQLNGLDQWLISNNLNFIQLIKKAIWSSLTLRQNTSRDTSVSEFAPGEELISKDLIGQLPELGNSKLNTGKSDLETDIFNGTNFISNFILLNKLVDDVNNARNAQKYRGPNSTLKSALKSTLVEFKTNFSEICEHLREMVFIIRTKFSFVFIVRV